MAWFRTTLVIVLLAATTSFSFVSDVLRAEVTAAAIHDVLMHETIASSIGCCKTADGAECHKAGYNNCCLSLSCTHSGLFALAVSFSSMRSLAHRPELLAVGRLVGRNIAPETGPPKFIA